MTTAHGLDADPTELVESFMKKFRDFAAAPTADEYDRLYDPDGTLWDAGMESPAPKARVLELATGFLRSIPDLRIAVRRYYARDNTVYLLTDNFGTYQGTPVSWPAVYSYRLREGRILEARRFYDQARVLGPGRRHTRHAQLRAYLDSSPGEYCGGRSGWVGRPGRLRAPLRRTVARQQ